MKHISIRKRLRLCEKCDAPTVSIILLDCIVRKKLQKNNQICTKYDFDKY